MKKIKTFLLSLLVLISFSIVNQACHKGATDGSVASAQAKLKKEGKTKAKQARKDKKAAEKRYWANQSREAKHRIKKTQRREKRKARRLRRKF